MLEVTVGPQTLSDQILKMSGQIFTLWSETMTKHLTRTSWVIIIKVLSVNKLYPVQFVKCLTKRKIWKDICLVNYEKLFPALNRWRSAFVFFCEIQNLVLIIWPVLKGINVAAPLNVCFYWSLWAVTFFAISLKGIVSVISSIFMVVQSQTVSSEVEVL